MNGILLGVGGEIAKSSSSFELLCPSFDDDDDDKFSKTWIPTSLFWDHDS